ncbi:Vegetative incompatibility protein HET-E-1, partial [Pseudocercospora fuligena]
MRLLNVQTLTLHEFSHQSEPPYAIASHRWLRDDLESSYQDVRDQQRLHLAGYCSVWFTRGWTLQELLVPSTVIFLNSSWTAFGYKGQCLRQHHNLPDLTLYIAEITELPLDVLYEFEKSMELSIDLRMSWIVGRTTQRIEDMAYCLLGLFDVSMPMIYGEEDKAFNRLWREIKQQAEDQESEMPPALRRNRRRLLDYDLRVR